MFGSRTIKTLAALFAAMTAGAISLMVLERKPPLQNSGGMSAVTPADNVSDVISQVEIPLQGDQWKKIIIHTTGSEPLDIAQRCHFIIRPKAGSDEYTIEATDLWRRQRTGQHVFVTGYDYNFNSIGICIEGDFSQAVPARGQFKALVSLTQALQQMFQIGPASIYLHRDIDARSKSPGDAFPADAFTASLLRSH